MTVLIAGGDVAGLGLGLTCHQIGVPFRVFEAADEVKPLGVGINLQPTAVRELFDLGLEKEIEKIGVRTRDYGMYSKHGHHIWTEPLGTWAGYKWPQFSVHRGALTRLLYDTLITRAGPASVETGWRATGFENTTQGGSLFLSDRSGNTRLEQGELVIGADGIHSAIRAQIAPDEGDPKWGGAVLRRGTTRAKPFLTGASMVMIGHDGLRFVSYPISGPDPDDGLAQINWIANLDFASNAPWNKEDWSRRAKLEDFAPKFAHFDRGWIDIPGLIEGSDAVFEYPMVDRDPLPQWTHGAVSLIGDAAHPAYPVGSNGAGSAIIDTRVLGRMFLDHGLCSEALNAYEAKMRPPTSKVTLMNRTEGPDSVLDLVEARSGGEFEDINDVIPQAEMEAHSARYKSAAGFGVAETNSAPQTILRGELVS